MDWIFALENLILWVIQIYSWVLVVYFLLSWFPNARDNTFGRFLASLCEPYLEPFRRVIPPFGMIDISSIVSLIVLWWLIPPGIKFLFSFFY